MLTVWFTFFESSVNIKKAANIVEDVGHKEKNFVEDKNTLYADLQRPIRMILKQPWTEKGFMEDKNTNELKCCARTLLYKVTRMRLSAIHAYPSICAPKRLPSWRS